MTLHLRPAEASALLKLNECGPHVRFVVIGAVAVGHHVTLSRPTADVDLAIVVAPADLDALLHPLGWQRDPRLKQRWYGPDGFKADVLPAAQELIEAGRVRLDGNNFEMSLVGFDLALEHAELASIVGTSAAVPVASLASLAVLKMVSWLDRPYERRKDLGDLAAILDQGLSDDDDRRWDSHHPVGASQLSFDRQSPYFVGLSVAQVAHSSHRERVMAFLAAIRDERQAWCAVAAQEAGYAGDDPEQRFEAALLAFEKGFEWQG